MPTELGSVLFTGLPGNTAGGFVGTPVYDRLIGTSPRQVAKPGDQDPESDGRADQGPGERSTW